MDKGDAAAEHFQRATALRREGRLDECLAEFAAALAIDPRHRRSWYGLATVLESKGRFAQAAKAFSALLAVRALLRREGEERLASRDDVEIEAGLRLRIEGLRRRAESEAPARGGGLDLDRLFAGLKHSNEEPVEFPGYLVSRRREEGPYGPCYRAVRLADERDVVVTAFDMVGYWEPRAIERLRKAKLIRHPSLVELLDWGTTRGERPFIVEEPCPGPSLLELMPEDPGGLPLRVLVPLAMGALDGLACLHSRNLAHTGVHPGNILVPEGHGDARAVLRHACTDLLEGIYTTQAVIWDDPGLRYGCLTRDCGSPQEGDLFALGAVLYFCATGLPPYESEGEGILPCVSWDDVMKGKRIPIRRRNPAFPPALALVIDRALAPEPKERFQDASEFREQLAAAFAPQEETVTLVRGAAPPRAGSAARILVVDDEETVLNLVSDLLREAGHEVVSASSVIEGMRAARRGPPDLVITDLVMPQSPGYDLIAGLYRLPATHAVPVVALTADGELVLKGQGDERGLYSLSSNIAAYLPKPFSAAELLGVVDAILAAGRSGKFHPGEPYYKALGSAKRSRPAK